MLSLVRQVVTKEESYYQCIHEMKFIRLVTQHPTSISGCLTYVRLLNPHVKAIWLIANDIDTMV